MSEKIFLTKAEIAEVTEKLSNLYDTVHFDCDGYLVSAELGRAKGLRLCIRVYVNGWVKGAWLSAKSEHEESRRFFRLATRRVVNAKELSELARAVGKRSKYYRAHAAATYSYRDPYWTSAAAMLRHFKANNSCVRLITAEEAQRRHEALEVERAAAQEVATVAKAGAS